MSLQALHAVCLPQFSFPFSDLSWTDRNKLADSLNFSPKAPQSYPLYFLSFPLHCPSQIHRETFPQPKVFPILKHFHTFFPCGTLACIPRKGEQEERREGFCHLCTLGWSLVLLHIKCSFSHRASSQRAKEGALLRGQLFLSAWQIRLLSPHHAKRMSNLQGI